MIPSNPDEVVVTDNGQYLYIGADGANAIVRVDLATNTIDQTISLGDIYADDLLVLPGLPESIVVAKHNWGA